MAFDRRKMYFETPSQTAHRLNPPPHRSLGAADMYVMLAMVAGATAGIRYPKTNTRITHERKTLSDKDS